MFLESSVYSKDAQETAQFKSAQYKMTVYTYVILNAQNIVQYLKKKKGIIQQYCNNANKFKTWKINVNVAKTTNVDNGDTN